MKSILQKSLKAALVLSFGVSMNMNCRPTKLIAAILTNKTGTAQSIIFKSSPDELNEQDDQGMTALMYCAQIGKEDLAKRILDKGANTEITDNQGNTAILLAAISGNTNLIKVLAEKNADLEVKNQQGIGLREISIAIKNPPVQILLSNLLDNKRKEIVKQTHAVLCAVLDTKSRSTSQDSSDSDSQQSSSSSQGEVSHEEVLRLAEAVLDMEIAA